MQHPRNHSPQRGEMPRPHAGATRPATETVASPWPPGPLASAALDAAARGWPVFPVRPWAKIPAVTDWENAATTDPDRITAWWSARMVIVPLGVFQLRPSKALMTSSVVGQRPV